jgi:hypothetical protein
LYAAVKCNLADTKIFLCTAKLLSLTLAEEQKMKKVLIMLLIIGLASSGIGLGTALGVPAVLTSVKLGNGTATGFGTVEAPAGTFAVSGTGNDIWNAGDNFQYAYMAISGDFDISARVKSITTTNTAEAWTKAGIMCRANITDIPTGAVSPFAFVAATTNGTTYPNGISWQCRRTATIADVGSQSGYVFTLPVYVRLTRTGNILNGYYSQDGLTWSPVGGTNLEANLSIPLTDPVYVGLAVSPHDAAGLATAVFDQVNVVFYQANVFKPTPADKSIGVAGYGVETLKWDAVAYPAGLTDWKVYFGNEPNDLTADELGTVTEPVREIATPVLAPDTTYYWRVDAFNTPDPNTSRGVWWSFTTKSIKPVITVQPVSTKVVVNCPGTFTATAQSGGYDNQGDMDFVWKNLAGDTVKTDLKVLTSTFQTTVVGTYYVEVSNANGTTTSNQVTLSTKGITFVNFGTAAAGTGMTFDGTSYTVTGSGADIWGTSDGCAFAYVPVTGDGMITARVSNLTGNALDTGWTKAGLMFRETLNANSMELTMVASKSGDPVLNPEYNRNVFQWRNATGGSTANSASNGNAPPKWLRLVRAGNSYSGYYSYDGINWTQQGTTQTFTMTANMYVGLAITSHDNTTLSTIVMDNVTSTWAFDWKPTKPTFSPKTTEGWVDPTKIATLSWTKSDLAPCGATYKVYCSANPDPTQSPLFTGTTAVDETKIDIPANTLPFTSTIYWRVDTVLGSDTVTGAVWSFDTIQRIPIIRTEPAPITVVDAGGTVNLNVVATTATVPVLVPMTKYQWYFAKDNSKVGPEAMPADDGAGNYSCPLVLTNVLLANEGEYYCVVTNNEGTDTSAKGRVLTHRMMLHYTFESVTGNTIPDQSESKIDATLITPTVGGTPKYSLVDEGLGLGKAIKLFVAPSDPNATYITTNKKPMELGVSGGLPRSVSVWAKAQAFNNAGLFDCGLYVTGQNFCLRTLSGYNNRWRVQYYSMDRDAYVTPSFNEWVHFVLVFDGVNSQLYVNGQLAKDVNGAYINYASPLNTDNTNNFVLGRYNNDTQLFLGLMDDFRLYNYALTAADAAQLYTTVKGGKICVPLLYDLDGDCRVDLRDFAIFAAQWARTGIAQP